MVNGFLQESPKQQEAFNKFTNRPKSNTASDGISPFFAASLQNCFSHRQTRSFPVRV